MDSKMYPQGKGGLKSRYINGVLTFFNVRGTELYSIDPVNAIMTMASGMTFKLASGSSLITADQSTIAAAGNATGNATVITADENIVTGADGTTGVRLPTGVTGRSILIVNTVQNQPLKVYPDTGGQINAGGADVAFSLGAGAAAVFHCTALLTWYVPGLEGITATPAELNILDGVTATAAELNYLDKAAAVGVQEASKAVIADANVNTGISKVTELHIGATGAEVQVTATPAELNNLDRVGAAGVAEASKAVVLDANAHVDAVKTAALHIGASGAEVQVTATPAQINIFAARINSLISYLADGMLQISTLLISAVPEKFKTTTTAIYTIAGLPYTKIATDNLVFSAADTINTGAAAGDYWGIWLVQIDAAGTISTKSPAADQVYANEAAAIAALPAVDANNIQLGYITVEANNGTDWVANTDDLTAASDCQAANFYDLPAVKSLPAAIA